MAGFNPCYCWNLKDGCVTVGIWTLMFSLCQLGLLGWQTDIIKWLKDKSANDRAGPNFGVWKPENERWPGYYEEYWMTGKEKFYLGLFVIQILNLIAAFFLLFASVSLIYGIHVNSKYLIMPWFPCIIGTIICSLAYCVMWWAGDVSSYWLVLTVVEVIACFINIYCVFCVIVQYRRVVRGYLPASEDGSMRNQQLLGYEYPYQPGGGGGGGGHAGLVTYAAPEKKVGADAGGVLNYVYEPEAPSRVQIKDAYGRPLPSEMLAYSGDHHMLDDRGGGRPGDPYPCSKSEMTEEWLKDVMQSRPEEPKIPILDHPPSPGGRDRRPYSRSKSLDALEKEGREKEKSRKMKSSKSKDSVSSKHSHHRRRRDSSTCSTCTSNSDTETVESNRKGRSRSEGRHHHRRVGAGSDSEDTGYSRSAGGDSEKRHRKHQHKQHRSGSRHHQEDDGHSRKHKHHHHHHRHHKDNKSEDDRRSRKRLRDVKREDKERRLNQQQQQSDVPPPRPETSSSAAAPGGEMAAQRARPPGVPLGAVPVFPFGRPGGPALAPGAISIPQHIVIPPQPKGAPNQPQRFHINSEITISYSDQSRPGSESEHRSSGSAVGSRGPVAGLMAAPLPVPTTMHSPGSQPPKPPPRGGGALAAANGHHSPSPIDTSGDSKGYGSTAV